MSTSAATRSRMEQDVEMAYQIQSRAGILGMARGTTVGLSLAVIAHYTWPLFRKAQLLLSLRQASYPIASLRQRLPFKAFLVSACETFLQDVPSLKRSSYSVTMSGLVFEAERALLQYQAIKRRDENAIRREARIALAKKGLVGTESEIAQWRDEHEAQSREASQS